MATEVKEPQINPLDTQFVEEQTPFLSDENLTDLSYEEKAKYLRVLMLSNAPHCPSGYGVQAEGLLFDWIKHYDARILCNWGVTSAKLGLNGLIHYPPFPGDDHASRTSLMLFKNFKPDVFVTLYDIWMGAYTTQDPGYPGGLRPTHPRWIPIVMVDHDPIPEGTLLQAKAAYKVVTPTKFGVAQFKKFGVEATRIPFGVDTNIYKPVNEETQRRYKNMLGKRSLPFNIANQTQIDEDSFVIVVNGANKDPYRKAFTRMFLALQIFLQNNPDAVKDTRMYVHSWMKQSRDIPHGAKILYVDQYCRGTHDFHNLCGIPKPVMARIYGAADVFFHLSQGGGFEVPILEAMSCGKPVIGSDFVGMTDLIKGHGWLVPPKTKYFTPLDALQCIADEFKAAEALEYAYNHPGQRKKFGEAGRKFALDFDWSKVNPQWHNLFREVVEEISYKPLAARKL